MKTLMFRNALLAFGVSMALAGPALADPPWRHDGPPGWSKHHHGWRDRDDWRGYRHGQPTIIYGGPRVVYVPPPVVYRPSRPSISIHLPLDLD